MGFKGKKRYLAVAAAGLLAAGTLFVAAENPDFRLGRNMEILANLMREVNTFYVEPVDADKLLENGAYGMLSELDPYTSFIPESEMEDFELLTTGKYGGVGSIIRPKGDWVYIAEPYKDSPADRAGLGIGDRIVEIDGRSMKGATTSDVSSSLKGDPGTEVRVKVAKFGTGEEREFTIKRERIAIPGVPYHGFIAEGIGYIQHSEFTEDCSNDMRKALMELKETGQLKALVLDYRGNGGGILQEAVKILSLFVPKGTEVVSMRGRSERSSSVFTTDTEPVDTEIPIVVLVGSGTASAAEIVAGALQDLDRAVIVGHRTYGKGLVQSTRPVGYNAYLKVTTAKYYIPSGRCIQAVDYARRNPDGSVASVPDSLAKEFRTAGGRKVYDGGGITPDLAFEPEYVSRFTIITYGKGYIQDFGDLYALENHPVPEPGVFRLSDADYGRFVGFMADKDVEYRSETSVALEQLRTNAGRERYLERIEEALKQIEQGLKDDKESNLMLYRDQLTELIEEDIILRHHYREGVTRHILTRDKDAGRAARLAGNREEYDALLRPAGGL